SLKPQRSPRGTDQHHPSSWFISHFVSQVLASAVLCGSARDPSLEAFSGGPCFNREDPKRFTQRALYSY
ncbi:MAG: hypothetical protein KAU10_02740, partial [Dehalococcoidia bacterium]|nr:hypothetical protein [Dehalococcoidia bacterium]